MTSAISFDDQRPAIDGGQPVFPDGLPLARPAIADPAAVAEAAGVILASGVLTNGPYVRRLEQRAAEDTVERTPGVREVEDHLRVQPQDAARSRTEKRQG